MKKNAFQCALVAKPWNNYCEPEKSRSNTYTPLCVNSMEYMEWKTGIIQLNSVNIRSKKIIKFVVLTVIHSIFEQGDQDKMSKAQPKHNEQGSTKA